MNLSELVAHQQQWEGDRGIDNGQFNVHRIQVELDEAKAETDPFKTLEELIDVVIITAGGMAKAANQAGIPLELIDGMIRQKLIINSLKYSMEYFKQMTPEEAQAYSRYVWSLEQGEFGTPTDVY